MRPIGVVLLSIAIMALLVTDADAKRRSSAQGNQAGAARSWCSTFPQQGLNDNCSYSSYNQCYETVLGREAKWLLRLNRWVPRILDGLIARKVRQLYAEEKSEIRSTKSETNSKSESGTMTETTRSQF